MGRSLPTRETVTPLGSAAYNACMRTVCAAASIGAVLALLAGCGSSHARRGLARASFPSFRLSFRYPTAWNRIDCPKQVSSFTMTVTYLTSTRAGSCPSSGAPVKSLDANGVFVWWWNYGFPGRTDRIGNFPGRPLTIGRRPARIATVSTHGAGTAWMPTPFCSKLGGERLIGVAIERPAPASGNWMMMTACLRGPKLAASEAAVRQMLSSVAFTK